VKQYRDDGPAAMLAPLGAGLPLGALVLTVLACVPLGAALALADASNHVLVVGLALVWFTLLAGLASGRPHDGRLDWSVPALLRVAEYTTVIWLAAWRTPGAETAAFAFLAAVVYHHYDIVYRVHTRGARPPAWRTALAGGWLLRLALVYVLDAVGGFRVGLYIAAAYLAAVCLLETIGSWRRTETRYAQ
jgi:hypothetical protein